MSASSGIWVMMADSDHALLVLRAALSAYSADPGAPMLVGDKPIPTGKCRGTNQCRASYASSIHPDTPTPVNIPTVFSQVVDDDDRHPMDIQWAIMTLLSINATFREEIATQSPPRGALLVREMPARFERYLIGSPTTAAMTPHEAVCDFVARVQLTYSAVEMND